MDKHMMKTLLQRAVPGQEVAHLWLSGVGDQLHINLSECYGSLQTFLSPIASRALQRFEGAA